MAFSPPTLPCAAFTTNILKFNRFMNFKPLLVCALLGALPSLAQSEAVVKILHLQTNSKKYIQFCRGTRITRWQLDCSLNWNVNTRGIKIMNDKARPTHLVYEGPLGQIVCQQASFCATKYGFPIGTFKTFEEAMEILAWKGRG
jgi:hypothetical protein